MGGGDLNLKKSWHPSTLRNIERVWKAEQKHEAERAKIEQLQKELAEERAREEIQHYAEDQGVVKKKTERLDWMYQGPAALVNRDEYLLGRKIDKTFEVLEQQETGVEAKNDDGFDVGATMFSSQNLSGTATVDLANKIREDPLFNIMKKEKEQKKSLLSNPVKMKQLQQILQASLEKGKAKKVKKHKKKKHTESDSDENMKNRKKSKHEYFESSQKHRKSLKYDSTEKERYRENSDVYISNEDRRKKYSSSNEREDYQKNGTEKSEKYHNRHYSTSHEADRRERQYSSSSSINSRYSHKTSSENVYKKNHNDNHAKNSYSRKLDAEERERRLKEMQENARWREEQQKRNKRRYEEDEEKEEKARTVDASDFIKPMLSKAAAKGSLENRVKQKIFTIQRKSADMDRNFARH